MSFREWLSCYKFWRSQSGGTRTNRRRPPSRASGHRSSCSRPGCPCPGYRTSGRPHTAPRRSDRGTGRPPPYSGPRPRPRDTGSCSRPGPVSTCRRSDTGSSPGRRPPQHRPARPLSAPTRGQWLETAAGNGVCGNDRSWRVTGEGSLSVADRCQLVDISVLGRNFFCAFLSFCSFYFCHGPFCAVNVAVSCPRPPSPTTEIIPARNIKYLAQDYFEAQHQAP